MKTVLMCGLGVLLTGCTKRHAVVDPPGLITKQAAPSQPVRVPNNFRANDGMFNVRIEADSPALQSP
jgi:hypothetical protein